MATINTIIEHGDGHRKLTISPLLLILDYCNWSHFKAQT